MRCQHHGAYAKENNRQPAQERGHVDCVRKATESGFVKTAEVQTMTQHSPGARHGATEFSVSLMSFSSILV